MKKVEFSPSHVMRSNALRNEISLNSRKVLFREQLTNESPSASSFVFSNTMFDLCKITDVILLVFEIILIKVPLEILNSKKQSRTYMFGGLAKISRKEIIEILFFVE